MSYISVDVEADGPVPGIYSMVNFGAVLVTPDLQHTFYGELHPISDKWLPKALAVSGFTREETLRFPEPMETMAAFDSWIQATSKGKPIFISDNNGFDWSFINYYFIKYFDANPFGWSSKNLNDLYKGMQKDTWKSFKHLRRTKHTHHPVDDAKGNAEALLAMKDMGLKIKLI